jgi:hypothetical protein
MPKAKHDHTLTAEHVLERLDYDPMTGALGAVMPEGRREITINGRRYQAGDWPTGEIDHADCNPGNDEAAAVEYYGEFARMA